MPPSGWLLICTLTLVGYSYNANAGTEAIATGELNIRSEIQSISSIFSD